MIKQWNALTVMVGVILIGNKQIHHGFKFYDCENCEGVGTIVKETK